MLDRKLQRRKSKYVLIIYLDPKIHLIALFMHAELFNNLEKAMEMQQQLK